MRATSGEVYGLLPDWEIERLASHGMISDYVSQKTRVPYDGGMLPSFGNTSFGYDVRLGTAFKKVVEEDNLDPDPVIPVLKPWLPNGGVEWDSWDSDAEFYLDPGFMVLGHSVEYIKMPHDVLAMVFGKSTNARCGINANVTPLEPGWSGHITIEISNTAEVPVAIKPGMGICQLLFLRSEAPLNAYGSGLYQNAQGVQASNPNG